MRIYDLQNEQQDAHWLEENYGIVFTQGRSTYRVTELREAEGNALTVTAKPGTKVDCFFFGYRTGMISGHADADGTVTFPLPLNFTYKLSGYGTHWVKIDGLRVIGLGVPDNVQNWRHLDVIFQEVE